ncbi:MAG TPA: hypothetical protein VIK67_00195 [Acholeplasma sp.]|jgi:hypothetical protein
MEALFIVLNDLNYLDRILEKFVELKVKGATIMNSQGMASAILHGEGFMNLLNAGPFSKSLDTDQKYSKTIFTVIPDTLDVNLIVSEISKIVEDSKRNVVGFMFTVPVSGIYPFKKK